MMTIPKLCCAVGFLISTTVMVAQEEKKDDVSTGSETTSTSAATAKKIQEVITLFADPAPSVPLADGSIPTDKSPQKSLDQAEILKRAVNFVKIESPKYTKGNALTTGTKAEFVANFNYKPKELNPQSDVQGAFTLHVSIEAKEGKYRYTISKLNHVAANGDYSGGDLYSEIPKCGSMKLSNGMWKQMRSEGIKQSMVIAEELKEAMKIPSNKTVDKDEW